LNASPVVLFFYKETGMVELGSSICEGLKGDLFLEKKGSLLYFFGDMKDGVCF